MTNILEKKYIIYESIGNFADIVYTSDNYNDCQDYLQQRYNEALEANDIEETEAAAELFYSYFNFIELPAEANAYLWNCCSQAGLQSFKELAQSYKNFQELQEYFPEDAPKETIIHLYINDILKAERRASNG